MDWTEVSITVDSADVDRAGDIAQMVVPYGIYIEDYSNLEQEAMEIAHIDLIDEDLLKKDRTKGIIHVYISPEDNPQEAIAFLSERLNAAGINHELSTSDCAMEDWINNWKQYYKPIFVGERLLILPSWEKPMLSKTRRTLRLEPGIAFGTGSHETTRLCMEFIEDYLRPQMNVLDVGCGSGILSCAALTLGAMTATGVDIDELAVKTAVENAKLNNLENRFTAIAGNLTDHVTGCYHMIVANIVADVIIQLLDSIEDFMFCDTVFIMSGIIDSRENDVVEALAGRFDIIDRKEKNGWVALVAQPVRRDSMSMLGVDFGDSPYGMLFR